jgi:hypothetical protein
MGTFSFRGKLNSYISNLDMVKIALLFIIFFISLSLLTLLERKVMAAETSFLTSLKRKALTSLFRLEFFLYMVGVILSYFALTNSSPFLLGLSLVFLLFLFIKYPLMGLNSRWVYIVPFILALIGLSYKKFLIFILISLSFFAVFTCVPSIEHVFPRKKILSNLLFILDSYNLLRPFLNVYFFYFSRAPEVFMPSMLSFYLLCFSYQLIIKQKSQTILFQLPTADLTSFFCYLVCSCFLYILLCRGLVNFSSLVWNLTNNLQPDIFQNHLLNMLGAENEVNPSSKEVQSGANKVSTPRNFSLFHHSNHTHSYNMVLENSRGFRYFGLFGGLLVGGATIYYMHHQLEDMRRQTRELERQTRDLERQTLELQRQNDLEEVSQGIKSKEWYQQKYGVTQSSSAQSSSTPL